MGAKSYQGVCLAASIILLFLAMPASARDIFVDLTATGTNDGTSWGDAFEHLQPAIVDAGTGGESVRIMVAQGEYKPDYYTPGSWYTTFLLQDNVAIYGGFPPGGGAWEDRDPTVYKTILSGDLNGDDEPGFVNYEDNVHRVVTSNSNNQTAVLDGFTVSHGNASSSWPYDAGAGILITEGYPTVRNCVFKDNHALVGAGMYMFSGSPRVENCAFRDNRVIKTGAGVFCRLNSSGVFTNCRFIDNVAALSGGGVGNYVNCSTTLIDCSFSGNAATNEGGAISNVRSSATIINTDFTQNTAPVGGAIANYFDSDSTLQGCTFSENTANRGACLLNQNSSPSVTNCTFTMNTASDAAGAVLNDSGHPDFVNCTFEQNSAGSSGGAMYNHLGNATVTDCVFSEDSAAQGGALYNDFSNPEFYGCTFSDNYAAGAGGAVLSTNLSFPTFADSVFTANSASMAGAVFNNNSSGNLVNCSFTRNFAETAGAMLSNEAIVLLTNCSFVVNTAENYAGAILDIATDSTLTNCTLAANDAAIVGGILSLGDGVPTLANCILWDNSHDYGVNEYGQILSANGTAVATFSCIQDNNPDDSYVPLGGADNNNIDDDPEFVRNPDDGGDGWGDDPETSDIDEGENDDYGDFHLLSNSPVIDAGSNTAVPPDFLDLDGNGITNEPIPLDLGKNARFVDVADVPDSGEGTPPIIDMGVFEGSQFSFVLSSEVVLVPEGQTGEFSVSLSSDPLETVNVSVAVTSGDGDISVQIGQLLTFDSSNYADPQVVTLAAAEDDDKLYGTAEVTINAEGFLAVEVLAIEQDNEPLANVLFVDANAPGQADGMTWADAFTELQDALAAAGSSENLQFDEIRIAQGTYTPGQAGNRLATFELINGVSANGGYAGFGRPDPNARDTYLYQTLLSGDLNRDDVGDISDPSRVDNCYHVVTGSGTDAGAVLDGVTVTAGAAYGSGVHGYGAGMFNYKGNPTVTNCTFVANSAANGGAAVYNHQANGTFANSTFADNFAVNYGAGMLNFSCSPKISNCNFDDNLAVSGGAVYNDSSIPVFTGCNFTGNSASDTAGAIFNTSSSAILTECTFIQNVANSVGGAIANINGSDSPIDNCTFAENSASERAGAVLNSGSAPTFTDCPFTTNIASNAGAVFNNSSDAVFDNCTFSQNTVTGSGGAVYNSNCTPTFTTCTVNDNLATYGGALYNEAAHPILTDCTFSTNSAAETAGAIFNYGANPILENCTFTQNVAASSGGAVGNFAASGPRFSNSTFTGNAAQVQGGAVFNSDSTPMLRGCSLTANQATFGAALYDVTSDAILANCSFTANAASDSAGAMFNFNSSPSMVNCKFVANTAQNQAGGIFNNGSSPTLSNCTLAGNYASLAGGIFNYDTSSPTIANCILWANTHDYAAAEFAQIYTESGDPIVTFSCIQDDDSSDGYIPFNDEGGNNIDDDPLFVQSPDDGEDGWGDDPTSTGVDEGANDNYGDLHLSAGSPCTDAADNGAVPLDASDVDDDGDTAEATPLDLDYSTRFVDDPDTPDTGIGAPPIVDMGVYEFMPPM